MALSRPKLETGCAGSSSSASALSGFFKNEVLVVTHEERIIACTPEARRWLKLDPEQILNDGLLSLPAALQKIIRETAAKSTLITRTVALPLGGINPITFSVSAVPLGAEKKCQDVIVVLNNLGDAKRAEQNLTRLDRLAGLGTLSAGMAHEVKNALVSVKTFVDLLLEKNRDAELSEVVRREICRIDSIIGQMLKYAGPSRPSFSSVRVHDVLDHSLRMVQPQIDGRLISLNRAFNAAPDAIKGDDYQLEQAFVNLLLNAIEAMGPNGSLTVATDLVSNAPARPKAASRNRSHVQVAIADTGIGVTPENMKHLFEPFFTTKQQGTGLGLTIARRIVQEHHGDISVQSQVNKGTTFSIRLPVHAQ